jgi:ribosomal protein S18 acetylase RimI-like enzyme
MNDIPRLSSFFLKAWDEAGPGAMGFSGATDEAISAIASPDFLEKRLMSPNTRMVVAEETKEVIGFASLRLGKEAELSGIVVLQKATGRGIGTRLLRKALDVARKRGYHRLSVKTEASNARAIGFYKKAGFTESHRTNEGVGRDRVPVQVLVKQLR